MSELEKLIKELCPNGVEYKMLDYVLLYEQPSKYIVSSTDYMDKYTIPVLTAGQTFILGYTNEQNGIYKASKENPVIIFDDFTTSFHWVEFDFKVKSSAVKMLRPKNESCIFKYLYYTMQTIKYSPADHTRQWIEKYSKFTVPIPPLPVQQEIVRILDNFTELTKELTKELTLRKKQYEHYRDMLLSFDDIRSANQMDNRGRYNNNVIYRKLGEICKYGKERISAETLSVENYVSVENLLPNKQGKTAASRVPTGYVCIAYKCGDILIGNIRPYLKKIWLADCDGGTNGDVLVVQINDRQVVQERFLYHCLSSEKFFNYADSNAKGAKMPRGDKNAVMDFEIPVPPLETQKRIVCILDKFEMLANSLSDGLPAEIEARKKQYEYYRDKLLDFKDVGGGYYLLEKIVQWLPLGEIATEMYRGAGIKRDEVTEEGIPCVRYGEIYTTYDIWFDECVSYTDEDTIPSKKYFERGDILFAITGESVEEIAKSCAYVGNERCLAGGDIVVMKHKQNPKYLAYALSTTDAQRQKSKGKIKSKVVHASVPSISSIVIPLPPLEIQGWIAEILDKFHSLSTDISEGIPAEIEARKKQYEYYRDKLLAFKNLENVV